MRPGQRSKTRLAAVVVTTMGAIAQGGMAGEVAKNRTPALAIENVAIVEVAAGRVAEPQTVVIAEGRIVAISAPSQAAIPAGAVRVDGQGRFLMPGLVDMHVHLFNNASHRPPNDWAFPLFIANGVTGIREMAARPADLPMVARWREEVASGTLIAPRVLAAGVPVGADSMPAARQRVREAKKAGADFIKIFSEVPEPQWRAIMEEARRQRIPVCGHVPATVSALTAAQAGQRSNEHLTQLYEACSAREKEWLKKRQRLSPGEAVKVRDDQEDEVLKTFDPGKCAKTIARLAPTRQVQVPTLVLPEAEARSDRKQFQNDPRWRWLRVDEQERWRRILEAEPDVVNPLLQRRWDVSRAIVKVLSKESVTILAGTDAPSPLVYPGWSLHKELELLVEAGLSPADALRAATVRPAEFLGLADETGTVAVGRRADLLLLEADPLRDIASTHRIAAVILAGRLLDRATLDALER